MKLHILSDLHIEFAGFEPPETDADVVILAGDIGIGLGGVEWAASQFPTKPVIYVPGNHEYYQHDIASIDEFRRLEGIIEKYQPVVWIHGHTHVPCEYEMFGTRVLCNPRGYPQESAARGFLAELVVEV